MKPWFSTAGVFDSLFYDGLTPTNKYTGANIYWLTYGGAAGVRMGTKDGSASGSTPGPFPHRLHLESLTRNVQYVSAYPKQFDADHWYDWTMMPTGTAGSLSKSYSFDIVHLATPVPAYPTVPDGLVKVAMLGGYNGAHNLRMYVNANLVFEQANLWSNFDPVTAQAAILSSYFREGSNTIEVQVYNAGKNLDFVYPNWIEVTYYDDYFAEGDSLAFENRTAGAWRYGVRGFSSSEIEAYDVTDMNAVRRFVNAAVAGSGPYAFSFGDATAATGRYLAVGANGWLKPARMELVVGQSSMYTPADLRSFGADYIIITHSDFWADAYRLARWRDQDFAVALVDVQQVYDQFNGGLRSAEAIHDFFAYAYTNGTPQPKYVVLLGDGTYDLRNYASGSATYIPPYLYLADPTIGETAADNRFVTLTGNDNMPEMHLGRLPANTPTEAKDMVDKIIAYESPAQCRCDSWNYNTLFVTDDWQVGDGDFYAYSDKIADGFVPKPPYSVTKAYLGQTCDVVGNPDPATGCQSLIKSTLENPGALFVSYVGHASKDQWAAEKLMNEPLLRTINNGPCLPIVLPMTCYEGSFHDPTTNALAEVAVRMPVHGFIASWSATGFGLPSGHDYLEQGVVQALLTNGFERLGPATTYAKRYLLDHAAPGTYDDLLDTYGLLGDPGLQVKTAPFCERATGVHIASFGAKAAADGVTVSWQTEDELDMMGFRVLRRADAEPAFAPIHSDVIVSVHSGSAQGNEYTYVDRLALQPGLHHYALEIVKVDGTSEQYGDAEVNTLQKALYLPLVLVP